MMDGAVSNPLAAEHDSPGLTQVQRTICTFTSPAKTFTDILRNTSWWVPFLLSVILGYSFVFLMQSRVGWDKITENTMKQNPKAAEQMASMPPAQRAGAMEISKKITKVITYSIPIISLLFAAICALVLWGTINFLVEGHATYGQVFAVWIYGTLPLVLLGVFGAISMFAGVDADTFNPQNPVGSNIGYYLSPDVPKWLSTFASAIDIFWIWSLILVGIGLAIVAKVKRSSGLIAIFGWWAIVLLVRMGFAAISG